jgi:eukaryotic-like serine/threonine-protein kinase
MARGGAPIPGDITIASRYELGAELGRGATATVYRARDQLIGVDRALKLLSLELSKYPQVHRRFSREARILGTVAHPHIVALHDVGEHDGRTFLVMDLVEGSSLKARLEQGGALAPRQAAAIVQHVLLALHHAHARGIVHRDVKPGNILLTEQGAAVVTDFGLGRFMDQEQSLTRPGQAMGTMGYMAPEQARDAGRVDNRTDVYAAGATLYACLGARAPHDLYLCNIDHSGLRTLPPPLAAVILRATRLEPSERYATAADMAHALRAAVHDLGGEDPDGEATMLDSAVVGRTAVLQSQLPFGAALLGPGRSPGLPVPPPAVQTLREDHPHAPAPAPASSAPASIHPAVPRATGLPGRLPSMAPRQSLGPQLRVLIGAVIGSLATVAAWLLWMLMR